MSDDNSTVEPLIPGVTFPTKESLEALFYGFHVALGKYAAANPKVPMPTVLVAAFHEMLRFPYHWLTQVGNEDKFAAYVSAETKHFLAIMEFQNAAIERMAE